MFEGREESGGVILWESWAFCSSSCDVKKVGRIRLLEWDSEGTRSWFNVGKYLYAFIHDTLLFGTASTVASKQNLKTYWS